MISYPNKVYSIMYRLYIVEPYHLTIQFLEAPGECKALPPNQPLRTFPFSPNSCLTQWISNITTCSIIKVDLILHRSIILVEILAGMLMAVTEPFSLNSIEVTQCLDHLFNINLMHYIKRIMKQVLLMKTMKRIITKETASSNILID